MAARNVKKVKQYIKQHLLLAGDLTEPEVKILAAKLKSFEKLWPQSYARAIKQFKLLRDMDLEAVLKG